MGQSATAISETTHGPEVSTEYWYLVYTNEEGGVQTVKGTVKGIRRSLREGLLGDAENVRAACKKAGPFEPLKHFPEFRDLVVHPAKLPTVAVPSPEVKAAPASSSAGAANVAGPPANASDSAILSTTNIMPAVAEATAAEIKAAARPGPCINLKARDSSLNAEIWRWVILGAAFAGAGMLATYLSALLRQIRLF